VPTPTSFLAIYGSEALLKVLSDEGARAVYLLAISGATKPRYSISRRPSLTTNGRHLSQGSAW